MGCGVCHLRNIDIECAESEVGIPGGLRDEGLQDERWVVVFPNNGLVGLSSEGGCNPILQQTQAVAPRLIHLVL